VGFLRMDQGTLEDWIVLNRAVEQWQSLTSRRIKSMLLQLEEQTNGCEVNQLQHSLQTATRALRDGASEELVVAALCHDIGTAISMENHSGIAAEILKPYVSSDVYEIVRTHQDFQRRHHHATLESNHNARKRYSNEPWFRQACRFSDEWDQISFDPNYDTLSLEHFEPMVDRIFKQPKPRQVPRKSIPLRAWRRMKSLINQRGPRRRKS
jgi:predicted HD phosphohydrolase